MLKMWRWYAHAKAMHEEANGCPFNDRGKGFLIIYAYRIHIH